jgi:hypothetical protein
MPNIKISLANVLLLCALMVYGVIVFLSVNFLPDANINNLYAKPVLYTLSLGIVAYLLAYVKGVKENFSTFLVLEWMLLLAFVGMAVLFLPTFGHYFNVSKNKTTIQESMLLNLRKADSVWFNYDKHVKNRINICKMQMNTAFIQHQSGVNNSMFNEFGFKDGPTQNVQIDTKIGNLSNKLKPGQYVQDKKIDSALIESTKAIISNWKPLGLIRVNGVLEQFTKKASYFKSLDQYLQPGENKTTVFNYTPIYEDTKQFFTTKSTPGLLPSCYGIGLYLVMLLSWFMAERNFKSPGLFFFFNKK